MTRAMILAAVLLSPALVNAQAPVDPPVNPKTVEIDLPQVKPDGTELDDLKAIWFCVGPLGAAELTTCVEVPVATPNPPDGATLQAPMAVFGLTADGDYALHAETVDLAENRSALSPRAPFVWNRQPSVAPTTPRFR